MARQDDYRLQLATADVLDKYPAKQHARQVQQKLRVECGLVYLPGARARLLEDSDMPASFRQRRYFYYMSGVDEPGCHLTYDLARDTLALFVPPVDPKRVLYDGRGSTPAEALARYDVDHVFLTPDLPGFLAHWAAARRDPVFVLHPAQAPPLPGLHINADALQPAMDLARYIKDEHEIGLIRRANDISSQAHRRVLASILNFSNEAQVEGLFVDVCISSQAKHQAYQPIAASGPNAGTLHYSSNNEDFGNRQLMCLDAGCEYRLYASDITRTFPLSASWPSSESENIHNLVQRMQDACISRLASGVRYLDMHILAHQIAIRGLLELGILHNGTSEEIFKAGTSRCFFPHGLGHHVGLEVHDVGQGDLMSVKTGNPLYEKAPSSYPENFHLPVYDANTCRSPTDPQSGHLEANMVVTVEPGIYFSRYVLETYLRSPIHSQYINVEVVKRYLPVGGVRIEDDILITSKGHENLTTAPKGAEMLKIIRSGDARTGSGAASRSAVERKASGGHEPLLRAPGILNNTSLPDFEPYNGPSLFSQFGQESSSEQRKSRQKTVNRPEPASKTEVEPQVSVCGDTSTDVSHTYLNPTPTTPVSDTKNSPVSWKPLCKNCTILVHTLGRLRHNLTQSEPVPFESEDKSPSPMEHRTVRSHPGVPPIPSQSSTASESTLNVYQRQAPSSNADALDLTNCFSTLDMNSTRRCTFGPAQQNSRTSQTLQPQLGIFSSHLRTREQQLDQIRDTTKAPASSFPPFSPQTWMSNVPCSVPSPTYKTPDLVSKDFPPAKPLTKASRHYTERSVPCLKCAKNKDLCLIPSPTSPCVACIQNNRVCTNALVQTSSLGK